MGKRKIGNLWEVIDLKQKETFLCIDLKSFYASVECVERGLDPFTTNLLLQIRTDRYPPFALPSRRL